MRDARKSIVLIPGFAGGKLSLAPLTEELRHRGHDAHAWLRAPRVYRRSFESHAECLVEDLLEHRRIVQEPSWLFGWSLGGLVAISAMKLIQDRLAEPPERIVSGVITYGSPFHGTWAGYLATVFDHVARLQAREMRPGHPRLQKLAEHLHRPRGWHFHAIYGDQDWLVRPPRTAPPSSSVHVGPFNHRAPLYDPRLFDLIHSLIDGS